MVAPWKTRRFWLYIGAGVACLAVISLAPLIVQWVRPELWTKVALYLASATWGQRLAAEAAWLCAVLANVGLGFRIIRPAERQLRAYDRWRRLMCTECDYNLRMHQPGDACPECGAVVPERPTLPLPHPPRHPLSWPMLLRVAGIAAAVFLVMGLTPVKWRQEWGEFAVGASFPATFWAVWWIQWGLWRKGRCVRCGRAVTDASERRCDNCGTLNPVGR